VAEFDSAIPPGGQGQVTASIDSTRFKNKISKSVTLFTNDPANERIILRMSAEIMVPVDVRPNDRIVVRGKPGELKAQEIWLVSSTGQVFDITKVQKRRDDLSISFEPAPELAVTPSGDAPKGTITKEAVASGHSSYKMTVKIAPNARPGTMADRIRLTTTHDKMANIDISVSGKLEGNVTVRPERLFFLSANGTSTQRQELRLTKRPEGGLEIKRITSTDSTFETQLVPVAEGKEYLVEVVRTEAAIGTPASARLMIETNDPLQPVIEVAITAR
jgi:hypothetical protein